MFRVRLASSVVIVITILIFGYLGGPALAVFLGTISVIGYLEFTKANKVRKEGHKFSALEAIGVATTVAYYVVLLFSDTVWQVPQTITTWLNREQGAFNYFAIALLMILAVSFISMVSVYVFTFPRYRIEQVTASYFGIIYIPVMLSFVFFTRELEIGNYLVWLIFICSMVSDTCAYLVGILIGKHKLAPNLSPKKTIEGSVGGVVCTTIAGGLYGWIFAVCENKSFFAIMLFALVGMVGAIVSQCGDLAASAIKRNQDIKDYGKIIPGHGGILDRFDSSIFTAPMVYFLVVMLLR